MRHPYAEIMQFMTFAIMTGVSTAVGRILGAKTKYEKGIVGTIFFALAVAGGLVGLIRMWEDTKVYIVYEMLLVISLYISFEDIMKRLVPNDFLWLIPWSVLTLRSWDDLAIRLIAGLVVGAVAILLAIISHGEGIGGADIKFLVTAAFLLGQNVLYAVLIGSVLSIVVGYPLRHFPEKMHNMIPMIPFFCVGTIAAMLIWR